MRLWVTWIDRAVGIVDRIALGMHKDPNVIGVVVWKGLIL